MDNYLAEGIALIEAGQYDAAVETLTKAIRLTIGDLAEAYYQRGLAHGALERYQLAIEDFSQAIAKNPVFADAYNERGNAYRFLGRDDFALADYDSALILDPYHVPALYHRALIHNARGEARLVVADLDRALALDPSIASAYELRGQAYAALGDTTRAIDDLERYLRMGGGRLYDNHSETQSLIISLRLRRWLKRLRPRLRRARQDAR
ncbi:MAG: tetratricopeptide repeat protein [Anaerolineae bacterium]|nr:tetratricopeptide repeat protein [Anaerolineae bacterium]MDW8173502.1 tetratricopeptide repeat protein [Anaerolineae bacterium]